VPFDSIAALVEILRMSHTRGITLVAGLPDEQIALYLCPALNEKIFCYRAS
jgi:hypothetical protein